MKIDDFNAFLSENHHRSLPIARVILLHCSDEYAKPSITKDPVSQIALKDGSLNLTCQVAASSHSSVTIEWKKDHLVSSLVHVEQC